MWQPWASPVPVQMWQREWRGTAAEHRVRLARARLAVRKQADLHLTSRGSVTARFGYLSGPSRAHAAAGDALC